MKATLEFNLPDDQSEYEDCSNGHKYFEALYDIVFMLRKEWKYAQEPRSVSEMYDEVNSILNEYCIDVWR